MPHYLKMIVLKILHLKVGINTIDVNLKAPAYLTKEFAKNIRGKNNNIINIIDQRVFKLTPFFFSYTLSKTGLYTLTKTSAMSLAPNIRVNGIAPRSNN